MKNLILGLLLFPLGIFAQNSEDCIQNSFAPTVNETYIISAWVKDDVPNQVDSYTGHIEVYTTDPLVSAVTNFSPSGNIIDGWQRIVHQFEVPENPEIFQIKLVSMDGGTSFFDDIRVFPLNGNMKSFVYDPVTQRLMAELDENNYATLYEYDSEGGLIRVKKETERGIYTIQETRSGTSKLNN